MARAPFRIHAAVVLTALALAAVAGAASGDAPGTQRFFLPAGYSVGEDLTPTPDGNLWTLLYKSDGTATLFEVSQAGAFTPFALPAGYRGHGPVVLGPDGNLWFIETYSDPNGPGGQTAAMVRATQAGQIQPYPIADHSNPQPPALGAGGDLWFGDSGYDRSDITLAPAIGRFHLSGPKQFQTDWYPTPGSFLQAGGFFTGPDGNAWFVMAGRLGEIDDSGQITQMASLPEGFALSHATVCSGQVLLALENQGTGNNALGRLSADRQSIATEEIVSDAHSVYPGVACGPGGRVFVGAGDGLVEITPARRRAERPADQRLIPVDGGAEGVTSVGEYQINFSTKKGTYLWTTRPKVGDVVKVPSDGPPTTTPPIDEKKKTPPQVKEDALDEMRRLFEQAKSECAGYFANLGTGAGGALISLIPGAQVTGMTALTAAAITLALQRRVGVEASCLGLVQAYFKQYDTYKDPPDANFRAVALPARVRSPAAGACRQKGVKRRFCRQLRAALRARELARRRVDAILVAIGTAVDRRAGAQAAGSDAGMALQVAALRALAGELAAAQRALERSGAALAAVYRRFGLRAVVPVEVVTKAIQGFVARLEAGGVPAADIQAVLAGALTPTEVDVAKALRERASTAKLAAVNRGIAAADVASLFGAVKARLGGKLRVRAAAQVSALAKATSAAARRPAARRLITALWRSPAPASVLLRAAAAPLAR